jgi:hypothetical protein
MKKTLITMTALLFLAGTAMVFADSASPKLTPKSKHTKKGAKSVECANGQHYQKGVKGGTVKPDLNPQPLPPGIKAPPGQGGNKAK